MRWYQPVRDLVHYPRKRYRVFAAKCIEVAVVMRRRGIEITPQSLAGYVGPRMGWLRGNGRMSVEASKAKAERWLGNADIAAGLRQAIPELGGPDLGDVSRRFKELLDQNEDPAIAAQMVRLGFTLMTPKPTKKVEVDQRSLVARVEVRDSAPPIRARVLDAIPENVSRGAEDA